MASVGRQLLGCATEVGRLLVRRRLHLRRDLIGAVIVTEDGRRLTVFRESLSDAAGDGVEVTLLVWFHLRGTTASSRARAWLFERESILNTVLYAGCPGFARKLWLVERSTGDYAGIYSWHGPDAADDYGSYITAVLRPLSTPGSVSHRVIAGPLSGHLREPSSPTGDERELAFVD